MRIKGVLRELDRVQEPAGIHLAQAKCYASMVAEQEGVDEIGVQMTHCQMETEEVKRFQYSYQSNELKVWFDEVIRQYKNGQSSRLNGERQEMHLLKGLNFRSHIVKGREILRYLFTGRFFGRKSCSSRQPTGVGKTISTVFPAVKAVGEELGEKIFI